jgi:RNA polymerase sigma-70 factor (ECF subfamily)
VLVLPEDLLDEAVQELRIRLWRAVPGIEQLAALSPGYFHRAAVTAALTVLRRRRAKRESGMQLTAHIADTHPASAPVPDETLGESDLVAQVGRAVDQLQPPRQAAVRLHLMGYHRDEIASLLGWSEAKTRNLLYRGLDDLRALLAPQGLGPEATV